MDFKLIFAILLCGHFGGDFYFQSQLMVVQKNEKKAVRIMLKHGLIYLATIVLPFLLFSILPIAGWGLILLIPLLHLFIDAVKDWWLSRKPFFEKHQMILFIADQVVHILTIAIIAYICAINAIIAYSPFGIYLEKIYAYLLLGLPAHKLMRLICLFLFLGKPVNIFIRKIIRAGDAIEQVEQNTKQKAGRIIGVLERYLTVILIILGQYAAVGFVFTAKSVTRFDKISKDPDFAEQYLIGTMSSVLFAITGAVLYSNVP